MDKMRQEAKGKLAYWARMCALFAILMTTNCYNYFRTNAGGDHFKDFFEGFQIGIVLVFLIYAGRHIIMYRKLLKNDEQLRNWYIKEHDERTAAICEKTGGTPLYTCGLLIVGAAIVAGYFDVTVFITLTACGLFLLLVRKGLYLYYSRTM